MVPTAFSYEGDGTFTALPRFRAALDAELVVGAMYRLDEVKA